MIETVIITAAVATATYNFIELLKANARADRAERSLEAYRDATREVAK